MANDFWETDGKRCLTCKFFDGYDVCCHKNNAGTVTTQRIQTCPFVKDEFDKYINFGVELERDRLKKLNKRNLIIDIIITATSAIHHLDIRSLKIPVPEKDDAIFSECYSYFGKDIFFFSHNCGATMTDEKIPIEDLQKILDFIISNK